MKSEKKLPLLAGLAISKNLPSKKWCIIQKTIHRIGPPKMSYIWQIKHPEFVNTLIPSRKMRKLEAGLSINWI